MSRIPVVKMSGAGNDFLVLGPGQAARVEGGLEPWVRRVCRRGLSVGADGVLAIESIGTDRVRVDFFNPDASTAFCGNGSRCAARFARLRGLAGDRMLLETIAGEVAAEVIGESVRLKLVAPTDAGRCSVRVGEETIAGRWVRAGSPHFVVFVDGPLEAVPLERWGPAIRADPRFGADGVNVNVASRRGKEVRLRTWERGVEGETLACGSGALAAAFAARCAGAPAALSIVPVSGIPLAVELSGPREAPTGAMLQGDARVIFEGELDQEATAGFPDGAL